MKEHENKLKQINKLKQKAHFFEHLQSYFTKLEANRDFVRSRVESSEITQYKIYINFK